MTDAELFLSTILPDIHGVPVAIVRLIRALSVYDQANPKTIKMARTLDETMIKTI